MRYKTCLYCGAHLDPGEKCDCDEVEIPEIEEAQRTSARTDGDPLDPNFLRRYRRWLES